MAIDTHAISAGQARSIHLIHRPVRVEASYWIKSYAVPRD